MARASRGIDVFEELHNRYGTHIALRVQKELSPAEFNTLALADLARWLEERAESAHREYEAQLENPLSADTRNGTVSALYRRWQGAEDLAYLILVAENAGMQGVKAVSGK